MKLAKLDSDELLSLSRALKELSDSYSEYVTCDEKEIDILKQMGFKVKHRQKPDKAGKFWYTFTHRMI
jgi:hypothetical protein